jgi:probable rRNA maturation factor
VVVLGRPEPVTRRAVVAAVELVLRKERRRMSISITFVGSTRIQRLNAEWLGHDRVTDVISFALDLPGNEAVGDIYIGRTVARRQAKMAGIPIRHELLRLVIHGTLHVLGHQHPEGDARTRSPMWRKQERYLACVV